MIEDRRNVADLPRLYASRGAQRKIVILAAFKPEPQAAQLLQEFAAPGGQMVEDVLAKQ